MAVAADGVANPPASGAPRQLSDDTLTALWTISPDILGMACAAEARATVGGSDAAGRARSLFHAYCTHLRQHLLVELRGVADGAPHDTAPRLVGDKAAWLFAWRRRWDALLMQVAPARTLTESKIIQQLAELTPEERVRLRYLAQKFFGDEESVVQQLK